MDPVINSRSNDHSKSPLSMDSKTLKKEVQGPHPNIATQWRSIPQASLSAAQSYGQVVLNRMKSKIEMRSHRMQMGISILTFLMGTYFILVFNEYRDFQRAKLPDTADTNIETTIRLSESLILISDASPHFLELSNIDEGLCLQNVENYFLAHIVTEDSMVYLPINVENGEFRNFQLCFADHMHHHAFALKLMDQGRGVGDCDMYLSASTTHPSQYRWDWKSNDFGPDTLKIFSFAPEFQESSLNALFIAVTGKHERNRCTLGLEIRQVTDDELSHRLSPTLRGGQIVLPSDEYSSHLENHESENTNVEEVSNEQSGT